MAVDPHASPKSDQDPLRFLDDWDKIILDGIIEDVYELLDEANGTPADSPAELDGGQR